MKRLIAIILLVTLLGTVPALAEETVDYLALQPLYLRAPNAQRNRKLVEAAHAQ